MWVDSVRVVIVENEGRGRCSGAQGTPETLEWTGSPIGERLLLLEEPWAKVSLDDLGHPDFSLAAKIAELELDVVLIGPVRDMVGHERAGMSQQVRDYNYWARCVSRRVAA